MTAVTPAARFTEPASAALLERVAEALSVQGFAAEVLDGAEAARIRIRQLIPEGASVFTSASETLRLSGVEDDINASGRYNALKPLVLSMDRSTRLNDIRQMLAAPDVVVGSVAAVTEAGALVIASATGSQLPSYSGGAASRIWIVGAQKIVPDLITAWERIEQHCLPLENGRAQAVYGSPSAVNHVLVLNAEPQPGRSTVLLLRDSAGF